MCKKLASLQEMEVIGHALMAAAKRGDTEAVSAYILTFDPTLKGTDCYYDAALRQAAREGHLEIVRLLIPVSNPKANQSMALKQASLSGHLDVVRELISVSDPRANDSEALIDAAIAGHIDIVRQLIPHSYPKARDSAALRGAAENNHLQIVRELIPVSDPQAKGSASLRTAARGSHHAIVKELASVSDVSSLFREELAQVLLLLDRVKVLDSVDSALLALSIAAVDALAAHVSEREKEWALSGLPDFTVARMSFLWAWREQQKLRANLRQVAPAVTPCRARLSL